METVNNIASAASRVIWGNLTTCSEATGKEPVSGQTGNVEHSVFITAAPVGAVPRFVDPRSQKFLPTLFVDAVSGLGKALEENEGWKSVEKGGLLISESTKIP